MKYRIDIDFDLDIPLATVCIVEDDEENPYLYVISMNYLYRIWLEDGKTKCYCDRMAGIGDYLKFPSIPYGLNVIEGVFQ